MTAEMKACPFCGGKPHSRTETDLDGFGRFYWFECGGCKARSDEKFATETCSKFYEEVRYAWNRRTDLSKAAVAAELEAAAQWHDAEIDRLEAQIAENNKYLQLAGKSTKSTANDFCDAGIGYHRGSAAHLRALHPASPLGAVMEVPEVRAQSDAMQAAVAKAVEASVNAENEACAKMLDNEADDYEADASRFRGGTDPHHFRMNLASTARKYAAAIRSRKGDAL